MLAVRALAPSPLLAGFRVPSAAARLIMRDLFRETFLGFVRVHLLHHAAKAPFFGTEMIEELKRHGYALSPGTLYPILHGLEAAGYLRSEQQVVNGKVRRYYRGTSKGLKALDKLKVKVRELTEEVLEGDHPQRAVAQRRRR
jgi:DNA-binding PadR family transcriptional regulator